MPSLCLFLTDAHKPAGSFTPRSCVLGTHFFTLCKAQVDQVPPILGHVWLG